MIAPKKRIGTQIRSESGGLVKKWPMLLIRSFHRQHGPSPIGSRSLELEAGAERRLGDLDLLGAWLLRRVAVLELVARLREGARELLVGISNHPAEELGRGGKRPERRSDTCRAAVASGHRGSDGVCRGGRREQ